MHQSRRLRRRLERLHRLDPRCHWCEKPTTLRPSLAKEINRQEQDATIDHLNSRLNFAKRIKPNPTWEPRTVLSCRKCNSRRAEEEDEKLSYYIKNLRSFGGQLLECIGKDLSLIEKIRIIIQDAMMHRASCLGLLRLILSDCQQQNIHPITDEVVIEVVKKHIGLNREASLVPRKYLGRYNLIRLKNERTFLEQFIPKTSIAKEQIKEQIKSSILDKILIDRVGPAIGAAVEFFRKQLIIINGQEVKDVVLELRREFICTSIS
jgi:hypothetical protein